MAGRSSALKWLALLAVVEVSGGCATGSLVEAARRTEWPVEFQAAFTDGEDLWLRYRSERRSGSGDVVATSERVARLRLSDLATPRSVGSIPVAHLEPEAIPNSGLTPVALVESESGAPIDGPSLLLFQRDDVDAGFRARGLDCCEAEVDLYVDSLVERRLAPLPLIGLPLSIAWDVVTTPPLAIAGVLIFGWTR